MDHDAHRIKRLYLLMIVAVGLLSVLPSHTTFAAYRQRAVTVSAAGSRASTADSRKPGHAERIHGDTTPPAPPVILAPVDGSLTNTPVTIISGTAEPTAAITVYVTVKYPVEITTTADIAGNWSIAYGYHGDGTRMLTARATDSAGNTSALSNAVLYTIDTLAPDTVITHYVPPLSNSSSITFEFAGIDKDGSGTAGYECKLDADPFVACTHPITYTNLLDGSHTFWVRAYDRAGNVDQSPDTATWRIDTAPPAPPIITTPVHNAVTTTTYQLISGSAEPQSSVHVFMDEQPWGTVTANGAGEWSLIPSVALPYGQHTVKAMASDAATNNSAFSPPITFVVDAQAPATIITAMPAALTASPTATFAFAGYASADTTVAAFECQIDGAAFSACTSPITYTNLLDGSHTFKVRAIDGFGTADSTPPSYSWSIDSAPLQVSVAQASAQADPASTAPISFSVTFSKPVSDFGDLVSDVDLSASTAPGTLLASISGSGASYTVTVSGMRGPGSVVLSVPANVATDALGNTNQDSATSSVTFDPSIPAVLSIVRADPSPTNAPTVTFSVTFSEAVANVAASDFMLATSGLSNASISAVSGSGAVWTVTASVGTGNGTLGLNLVDNDTILSVSAAIPLGGDGVGNGSFTGAVYTIATRSSVYLPLILSRSQDSLGPG